MLDSTVIQGVRPTAGAAPGRVVGPPDIPWLAEAERMMRTAPAELSGRRDLLHRLGRMNRRTPWTVPWCGLLVAHCLRVAMPGVAVPALPARARPWKAWGVPVRPQLGAVMVFWHYHPRLPFGHAAFYWAEDEEAYHVLGGNQDHRVCVRRYPKSRLVTARWPEGLRPPGLHRSAPPEAARPFR